MNYRAAYFVVVVVVGCVAALLMSAVRQTDTDVRLRAHFQQPVSPTLQAYLDEPFTPPPCNVPAAAHLAGVVDEVCERGAVVIVDRQHNAYCHPSDRRWHLQDWRGRDVSP